MSFAMFGMSLEEFEVDVIVRRGPRCPGRIVRLRHRDAYCMICSGTWHWTTQLFGRASDERVAFTLHLERDRDLGMDDEARLAPFVEGHKNVERTELRCRSWFGVDRAGSSGKTSWCLRLPGHGRWLVHERRAPSRPRAPLPRERIGGRAGRAARGSAPARSDLDGPRSERYPDRSPRRERPGTGRARHTDTGGGRARWTRGADAYTPPKRRSRAP